MQEPQRGPQTLYAAVILAAFVAVIVVARRWQSEPSPPPSRTAPQLATSPHIIHVSPSAGDFRERSAGPIESS